MNRDEAQGTWVFLVVLSTLFVVSVASPNRWQRLLKPQARGPRLVMPLHERPVLKPQVAHRRAHAASGAEQAGVPASSATSAGTAMPTAEQPQPLTNVPSREEGVSGALGQAAEHEPPATSHAARSVVAEPKTSLYAESSPNSPVLALGGGGANPLEPGEVAPPSGSEAVVPVTAAWTQAELSLPECGSAWLVPPPTFCQTPSVPSRGPSAPPASLEREVPGMGDVYLCPQPAEPAPLCRFRPVEEPAGGWVAMAPSPPVANAAEAPTTQPAAAMPQVTAEEQVGESRAQPALPTEEVRAARGPWRLPDSLAASLDSLARDGAYSEWARLVQACVRELAAAADAHPARAIALLADLAELLDERHPVLVGAEAEAARGAPDAMAVLHLAAAMRRLLAAWELVAPLPDSAAGLASRHADRTKLADSLAAQQELERWRVARDRWADAILAYEEQRLPSLARAVVSETVALAGEAWPGRERLDSHVSTYYRGPNLRLAVHARLLDRFVPPQPTIELPVNERVLGLPTRGWSTTNTQVRVRLVPDPHCVRLHLVAEGVVAARTSSSAGLATLFNASQSPFVARKEIAVTAQGLMLAPASAQADSSMRLRGVQTDFDGVPILDRLIQGIVRSRHEQSRARLRSEARRKVVTRVSQQLDATAGERIEALASRIEGRLLEPLAALELRPEVVELSTTAERATVRARLAGPLQLAAHTPRPLAPSHSLASLQLHESLLNNLVERLELNGLSCTVPELQARICERFQLPAQALSANYSDDLRVTFAPQDAVYLRFDQEKVALQLNLAEIRTPAKSWRDISAKVFFRPQCNGLHAQLVRDGAIQLTGPRLSGRMLIALRGVFVKIFPADQPVELMPERLLQDPRLAGLEVTQLVFQDGWLGLALAPAPPPASARWYWRRRYVR